MDPLFAIGVERNNGTSVVRLTGEVDLAAVEALRAHCEPLSGNVVIDLEATTFLDSSGIGALVVTHNRISAGGGSVVLRKPSPTVRHSLEIVGIGEWITDE
jgi:anti-anti-sigma factor